MKAKKVLSMGYQVKFNTSPPFRGFGTLSTWRGEKERISLIRNSSKFRAEPSVEPASIKSRMRSFKIQEL